MNKKFIIVAVSTVVLMCVVFLVWQLSRPPLAIENILPSGAIGFTSLANPAKHLARVAGSGFVKELAAVDTEKVMARNGFTNDKIKQVKNIQGQVQRVLTNPWVMKILEKEMAVAVYHEEAMQEINQGYDLLIALRLQASVVAAEFVGQMSKAWGEDVTLSQSEYKGIKIHHVLFKKNGQRIAYVRVRDLLIATLEPSKQIERVVDVYQGHQKPLGQDEHFMDMRAHAYVQGQGFLFINMTALSGVIKTQLAAWLTKGKEAASAKIDAMVTPMDAVYAYGFSYMPGEIAHFKLMAGFDPSKLTPQERKLTTCPQAPNVSLSLVPANAIAYYWSNCYDFKEYWQQAQEQAQTASPEFAQRMEGFKHKLEKRLKLNINSEVLPVLGGEAGGYLTDVDTTGLFPFPRILFFVKINNRERVEDLMGKVLANPIVRVQDEDYAQTSIRYMQLPFGVNMDLGYCLVGDYLLIASSRQLLKKSIDAYAQPERSMTQEKTFKQFALGDGKVNNTVSFMKLGDLSLRLIALAEWANKYFASQVNVVMANKGEEEGQQQELIASMADKDAEVRLVKAKIKQLKLKSSTEISPEEVLANNEAINHLQQDLDGIFKEIQEGKAQIKQIDETLANDEEQVKSARLVMFNIEKVIIPLFKGVGTLNAQGLRVVSGDRFWESELLLK